mmetsp:Transcript_58019/g.168314  ORF Transcript_58019/g.168314 Transcript_58019/m.168314 type:complete len:296 (+) Transcript_58019:2103-2990(+)
MCTAALRSMCLPRQWKATSARDHFNKAITPSTLSLGNSLSPRSKCAMFKWRLAASKNLAADPGWPLKRLLRSSNSDNCGHPDNPSASEPNASSVMLHSFSRKACRDEDVIKALLKKSTVAKDNAVREMSKRRSGHLWRAMGANNGSSIGKALSSHGACWLECEHTCCSSEALSLSLSPPDLMSFVLELRCSSPAKRRYRSTTPHGNSSRSSSRSPPRPQRDKTSSFNEAPARGRRATSKARHVLKPRQHLSNRSLVSRSAPLTDSTSLWPPRSVKHVFWQSITKGEQAFKASTTA